jgi:hypothetical protein
MNSSYLNMIVHVLLNFIFFSCIDDDIVDNRKERSHITLALTKQKMVVYRKKIKQEMLYQLDQFIFELILGSYSFTELV